jgi:hypothetical protein
MAGEVLQAECRSGVEGKGDRGVAQRVRGSAIARGGMAAALASRRTSLHSALWSRRRAATRCFGSPRAPAAARPNVTTAHAAGIAGLPIVVDTPERYAYRVATQQAIVVKRALACGDDGVTLDGRLVAAAERTSLPDLVSSLIDGTCATR